MGLYTFLGSLARRLPPELSHSLTVGALAHGLGPRRRGGDDPALACRLWGLDFANPVGLAAGFDKDARAVAGTFGLGFGFVEIGTVTPRAQPGNPRPRLFRLAEDAAIINRLGFNNRGAEAAARSLVRFRAGAHKGVFAGPRHADAIVGVNIGRNRDSTDAAADYAAAARALAGAASYLVINVSSPNTPGLRALQGRDELTALVAAVRAVLPKNPPPLLVKIAPDLDTRDMLDIAHVARGKGVDGLIVSNTTIARPADLASRHRAEPGGLSGKPLMGPSTEVLAEMYRLTRGQVPLVGVGGIAGGGDAYAKIRAGASLVQLYTALVFEGPDLIARIKEDLVAHLRKDGFATIAEAVGADHR